MGSRYYWRNFNLSFIDFHINLYFLPSITFGLHFFPPQLDCLKFVFSLQVGLTSLLKGVKVHQDLVSGPVVKNPPSNAGYPDLIPGRGTKIPYATGQLISLPVTLEPLQSRTYEPQLKMTTCHSEDPEQPKVIVKRKNAFALSHKF